jgi:hypothetical protein
LSRSRKSFCERRLNIGLFHSDNSAGSDERVDGDRTFTGTVEIRFSVCSLFSAGDLHGSWKWELERDFDSAICYTQIRTWRFVIGAQPQC